MKKYWEPPLNEEKGDKKRIILVFGIIFAALIILTVLVIAYLNIRNSGRIGNTEDITAAGGRNEDTDAEDNNGDVTGEDASQSDLQADQDPSSEDAADVISGKVTGAPPEGEDAEEPEQIVAEVAPVDDAEDPQQAGTAGEKIEVGDLTGLDNKNQTDVITYGIDVAKWQGIIDWKQVKEAGVEFVMIRVGYRTQVTGVIYEDPYAKYNMQQAQANKIKIGAYFFSTAVTKQEAKEEAAWVAEFIAPYPITYPVAYNCEGFSDKNNRQYGLSQGARTDVASAFLDAIKKHGYDAMFYAAKNELEGNAQWDTDILSSRYKIWVAQYPQGTSGQAFASSYTGKHAMWQYTSVGQVPGIPEPVDINVAYFGYDEEAEAKDDTPPEQVSADPAALINFTEVNEKVTAKIETNLRSVPSSSGSDTIVDVLKNGETATRTGIGDNGWSRVKYNGQILYAVSSYLTTDLSPKPTQPPKQEDTGPEFAKVNEQVTAKKETNLRSEPSTASSDTVVAVLKNGDTAIRTGISDNGWSRVEYNGQVLYAVTNYLTTDTDFTKNNTPSLENPEAGIIFTEVEEQVTAKEKTNLRLLPSTESDDTIAAVLYNGDMAIRTGIGDNGWSRLEYNDQILYAVTSYLIKTDNEE